MKIIYSGGFDKYLRDSVRSGMYYRYDKVVNEQLDKGVVVASINFAKPDSYYDSRIDEVFAGKVIGIDTRNEDIIQWEQYDVIFMPGGNQNWLKEGLLRNGFDVSLLKENVVIIGDSAGAYVMAKYFPAYDCDVENITERNIQEFADEGIYPESNIFTIAHTNNIRYVPSNSLEIAKKLAAKLNCTFLPLNENEERMLDENGNLVEVNIENLFSNGGSYTNR
jgi:hypothetical protein